MAPTRLKKLRLMAMMTQKQVAEAMGVSQPNYQRWEAGTAPVPDTKLKKLARVLGATVDEVLGKPAPFDLSGVHKSVGDAARKYFGEVAIHFGGRSALLLPISKEERSTLHNQLQGSSNFIFVESLDNRTVFIRKTAIKDVYFSSEAYDTYGPEEYEDYFGVFPDEDFWQIIENMESDHLYEEFGERRVEEVLNQVVLTIDAELDDLIASGDIAPEDREKRKIEKTEKLREHAMCVTWQLSSGPLRREYIAESKLLDDTFFLLYVDQDDLDDLIYLPVEGYHRSIFIRKSEIDYISAPTHKLREASLETAEEELDRL